MTDFAINNFKFPNSIIIKIIIENGLSYPERFKYGSCSSPQYNKTELEYYKL